MEASRKCSCKTRPVWWGACSRRGTAGGTALAPRAWPGRSHPGYWTHIFVNIILKRKLFFSGIGCAKQMQDPSAPACAKATRRHRARTDLNSTIIRIKYHGNLYIFMPPREVRRADKGGRWGARCLLRSPVHIHYAQMFSSFTITFPHQVLHFARSKSWIYWMCTSPAAAAAIRAVPTMLSPATSSGSKKRLLHNPSPWSVLKLPQFVPFTRLHCVAVGTGRRPRRPQPNVLVWTERWKRWIIIQESSLRACNYLIMIYFGSWTSEGGTCKTPTLFALGSCIIPLKTGHKMYEKWKQQNSMVL